MGLNTRILTRYSLLRKISCRCDFTNTRQTTLLPLFHSSNERHNSTTSHPALLYHSWHSDNRSGTRCIINKHATTFQKYTSPRNVQQHRYLAYQTPDDELKIRSDSDQSSSTRRVNKIFNFTNSQNISVKTEDPNSRNLGEVPNSSDLRRRRVNTNLDVSKSSSTSEVDSGSLINHNLSETTNSNDSSDLSPTFYYHPTCIQDTKDEIASTFLVIEDFITPEEEQSMLAEVEPHFKRVPYEFDHWDDAIVGFRETEVARWSSLSAPLIDRLKGRAFSDHQKKILIYTHVLDLAEAGHIKPHVDSVRFSGNIISGLSLHSPAVMRLVKESQPDQVVDILLPPRSLYIMRDGSRYNYTHEVLSNDCSKLGDRSVPKTRRISVICRNEP